LTYWLPFISGFSEQAGIQFEPYSSFALVNVPVIQSCMYGIRFGPITNPKLGIMNHRIRFELLSTCQYGIMLESQSGPGDQIQGIQTDGSIIKNCDIGICFRGTTVESPYCYFSGNYFHVGLLNGDQDPSSGIVLDHMLCQGGNVFHIPNFGSLTDGKFVECWNGAAWYNTAFRLGVWHGKNSGGSGGSYNDFSLLNGGVGTNSFEDLMNTGMNGYAQAQVQPDKSTFGLNYMPGKPIFSNTIVLNLHFEQAFPAGQQRDYYAYSPYCMGGYGGGSRVGPRFTLRVAPAPLVVIGCDDESEFSDSGVALPPEKNRIRIRVYAIADIPAGSDVSGLLEVAP
jgi:hypothetical protein